METDFLDVALNDPIWFILITTGLIAMLVMAAKLFFVQKDVEKKKQHLHAVLYIGGLSFLFGVLSQILGLISALDAITRAGDISFGMVTDGLKASFYLPAYGLSVFALALLIGLVTKISKV
ncbi:MotA/TolQ/ExbB proton channel family protein [Flammeovirgaceae bacterium SG7u.111]|nr:MotA/TolQ/ExbB proton channel family protein [Flammeovirgaceae bacterium SG7u.132]WPO33818.1 MotA/TolQ/ExbB proton channel family protein [Flammeovirgaceae bacterium SG7u.111]